MATGISRWWGNWGCCCNEASNPCPCACYPFDGNLNDMTGRRDPFTGDPVNYEQGKIKKAFKISYGNSIQPPHHSCFSLAGGFSAWVWIYHGVDVSTVGSGGHQIIRKGSGTDTIGAGHKLEWVFATTTKKVNCDASSPDTILFGVGNTSNGTVESVLTGPANHELAVDAGEYPYPYPRNSDCFDPHWTFYFMYYDPDEGSNGAIYIGVDGTKRWTKRTLFGPVEAGTDPVYIGADVDEQLDSRVDNLGFCKSIGTETEMKARSVFLYNGGYGRACPSWKGA